MKKTEALHRARRIVPPPVTVNCTHFELSVPADFSRPLEARRTLTAASYLGAQHARAYAVSRVALTFMGLGHVPLSPGDGGTVAQLMAVALRRAAQAVGEPAPLPFWQVRLGAGAAAAD